MRTMSTAGSAALPVSVKTQMNATRTQVTCIFSLSPHPDSPLAIHPKSTLESLAITRNKTHLNQQSICAKIPTVYGRPEFVKVRLLGLDVGSVKFNST